MPLLSTCSAAATVSLAVLATLCLLPLDTQAGSVTCQSRNMKREECRLYGNGTVVLVRQTSSTACVKGRNWDETRYGLYVTDGCGGVFETRDGTATGPAPGNRPDPVTGRPLPGMREDMRDSAVAACLMRFNNEATGATSGALESHRRLRTGVWELTLLVGGQRHNCQVNDRGEVIAVNPAR